MSTKRASLAALILFATLHASQAQTPPWLSDGENPSLPINRNGDFKVGQQAGSHLGRATGWVNEITSGDSTGYWQTPQGPSEKNTRFLFVNRGYRNWSRNEVRLVPAKPPVPSPAYDGFSLQLFPYLDDQPESLTVTFPAIGVRQGEASYVCPPITLEDHGAMLLQARAWVPDHTADIPEGKPQRPSAYLSFDFVAGQTSVGANTEIRIPVELGTFEEWSTITVRVDWYTTIDAIWFEWRVWDPKGNLVTPTAASARTRCTRDGVNGVEAYPFKGRAHATPWSACSILEKVGAKYKALQAAQMLVQPRILTGTWLAVESTYAYYPLCGEAYIDDVCLRSIRAPVLPK